MIFLFLVANVLPNRRFIPTYGRDKVSRRPEAVANVVLFPLAVNPCQVDRALALDEANHMRHRMFRRNRDHHGDVIRAEMPLVDRYMVLRPDAWWRTS